VAFWAVNGFVLKKLKKFLDFYDKKLDFCIRKCIFLLIFNFLAKEIFGI